MRTAKRIMILSLTAAMAAALVSCGDKAKAEIGSEVGSNAAVSADTSSEISAWDTLTDKEKDFYNELEKKGHTIKKDTGYVYIDAAGYADEWGNTFGDEGIVISYYFGSDEVVHVPEEIDGKKVVNVAGPPMWKFGDTNDDQNDDHYYLDYMFNIRELYFPEDLQEIKGAFNACETLEKIELPKSQTEIGFCCFRLCTGLKEFTCPEGLTTIAETAFEDCDSLTIKGKAGSYAEEYAKINEIGFAAEG